MVFPFKSSVLQSVGPLHITQHISCLLKSFPFGLGIAKTTLALVCISYEHVADGGCLIQNPYNSITQLAIHSKPDHNCTTHNTILQNALRMTRPEELILFRYLLPSQISSIDSNLGLQWFAFGLRWFAFVG